MGGLALVDTDRGELPRKGIGDLEVVVGARGPHQPHLLDQPRLQTLLAQQLGVGNGLRASGKTALKTASPTAQ